jgi:hypothetical protein
MIYKNNVLDQEVAIEYNDYATATLTYMKGQTKGVYQFEIETVENVKSMKVNYSIGQTDSGSIEFNVSNDNQRKYVLNVKPDNRPSFVIEKDREEQGNQGQNQQKNGKN